jgi:hypothetical protein
VVAGSSRDPFNSVKLNYRENSRNNPPKSVLKMRKVPIGCSTSLYLLFITALRGLPRLMPRLDSIS